MPLRRTPCLLALMLSGAACHESSSDPVPLTETLTSNLGLAIQSVYRSGDLQFFEVPEARQDEDLNADGDSTDRIAFVVDLERRAVVNTGLGGGFPHSAHSPQPIVTQGETLAFGVSEWDSGLDRNGDGDVNDRVLGIYERDTGSVTNLGLAVRSAVSDEAVLACAVAEVDQGEDLDGDGDVDDATTVFVHDRRTGETWNAGTLGTTAVGVQGDFVSLSVDEAVTGDRNGDGDVLDLVFELYDVSAREFQHVGLALSHIFNPMAWPAAHRGRWAVMVTEAEQGGTDLDGDGDALDHVAFLYDPVLRTARNLGQRIPRPVRGIEPLVLYQGELGTGFATQEVWLYDADADLLTSTGLHGIVRAFDGRLVVEVDEESQGEDLDRNGFFDSVVPVFYDLDSGRTQSLGIDGDVQSMERGLLVVSRESASRRDWNGDGDRDDAVLFTWGTRTGLVNTRLDPYFALPLGEDVALLVTDEAAVAQDLNGDGDIVDHVLGTYDAGARRVTNLGLAGNYVVEGAADGAVFSVAEWSQGTDLNGNGRLDDHVLHLTEILFFALHAGD